MSLRIRALFGSTLLSLFAFAASIQSLSPSAHAQAAASASPEDPALPGGVQRAASVEGITEYHLSNGLRVLLFPEPSKPTVTVNVTYLVGSSSESYGETGMAHLLEHLMFKGSTNHRDIPNELSERGARANGTTSYDRTNYYETFQATDENLNWALDLEADRMVNSFIDRKDLDSEMTVVRNEFEIGENSPLRILQQRVLSAAYLWHNYGKSTIGARSDIENVPIERLQAFYRNFYQPDNAVLIVAGKFDELETLKLIAEKFGTIPRPTRTLPNLYTAEPPQDGERSVVLRRVGDTQLLFVVYHIPPGSHPDFVPVQLMAAILSDTPSGRLYKALVETRKASSVSGGSYELRNPGIAAFLAEVRAEGSLDEARDIMLRTIEKAAEIPVTAEELERQRTAYLKYVDLVMNDTEEFAMAVGEAVALGDWRLFFVSRDRLKEVSLDEVQKAAAKYFVPSNRTLGMFYPSPEPPQYAVVPSAPDIGAMVEDYRGSAKITAGEDFDPSVANIESRTKRYTLPSGLRVALLPKKTRGATVSVQIATHFGDAKSLESLSITAEAVGRMLMRGTSKHTRQEIQDTIDRLQAVLNVSGSATGASAYIETKRERLAEVLRLAAEILQSPAFPEAEFEPMRQEWLASLEQDRSDPQALAILGFQKHLNPYPVESVRYTPSLDEEAAAVSALRPADLPGFYRRFYGGSKLEIAFVGDFDENEAKHLVEDLFAGWKSPGPFVRVPREYFEVPPINRSIDTPGKQNAMFLAGMNLAIKDDDPDYAAMVLSNYMLGGGFLNSRLATRIRRNEGLSYGVGSQFSASPLDRSGTWLMYAFAAPQNMEKLESVFKEELETALRDGFSPDEMKAAKSGLLQSRQNGRAEDRALASMLAENLFLDRSLQWDAELEKRIAELAPDELLRSLRRFLDPGKLSIVKAGDFENAESEGAGIVP